ncbi:MAG TPA: tetratricopeptide repeat protein [Kofleriaceae bacterium]|nr:tetratricopeptide repeat protein [Kofleriaceae bacterium]
MKRKKDKRTLDDVVDLGRSHVDRGELAQAEACFREALAMEPEHLGVITLLGLLLVEREKFEPAIDLLERARDAAPEFAPVQLALGSAYAGAGHDDLAVVAMETAIKLDTTSTVPLERLAKHYIVARKPREAIGLLRRVLRRDPTHAHAQFLLAGLTGDQPGAAPPSPPAELIADLFDAYATKFDEHLVGGLQYSAPKALAALVSETGAKADGTWRVVDLGCGTGLAGIDVRPYAKTLIGSDLSPRMIARARERKLYDELHVEDLVTTLTRERDVDLVVATDVFIYVGALEATFAACATALRTVGLLAFSVERSDGEDVILGSTLRYSHSDGYIRRLADAHGLTVLRAEPTTLRVEEAKPVAGVLYILQR